MAFQIPYRSLTSLKRHLLSKSGSDVQTNIDTSCLLHNILATSLWFSVEYSIYIKIHFVTSCDQLCLAIANGSQQGQRTSVVRPVSQMRFV